MSENEDQAWCKGFEAGKLQAELDANKKPSDNPSPLNSDQVYWVRTQVAKWLDVKFNHEKRGITTFALRKAIEEGLLDDPDEYWVNWGDVPGIRQLIPDVWHSALLLRLLEGKDPLPEPPPTEHSYPVYPD